MKELSIEEKARLYDEAIINGSRLWESDMITRESYEFIFPSLKESKDERIRKAISYALSQLTHSDDIIFNGITSGECIDWLENQGKHAKFRDSIQVGDKVTRNEDGVLVNLSQLKRVAKKDEKQGEQKPLSITDEWIENYWQHEKVNNPYSHDKGEEIQFDHQGFVRFCKKYCKGEQKPANWLQELEDKLANATPKQLAEWKEKYFKEEAVEWSEENEKYSNIVYSAILSAGVEGIYDYHKVTDNDVRKWLDKFLKPQPKPEWSEEDEKHYQGCLNLIRLSLDTKPYPYYNDYLWLKVLKDRVQPQNK